MPSEDGVWNGDGEDGLEGLAEQEDDCLTLTPQSRIPPTPFKSVSLLENTPNLGPSASHPLSFATSKRQSQYGRSRAG